MKMYSIIATAGLLLASLTASADAVSNCDYQKMMNFAVQSSMLPKTYGEPIVRTGGSYGASPEEAHLLASIVSAGGNQEIMFVQCDANGSMAVVASHNPALKVISQ